MEMENASGSLDSSTCTLSPCQGADMSHVPTSSLVSPTLEGYGPVVVSSEEAVNIRGLEYLSYETGCESWGLSAWAPG